MPDPFTIAGLVAAGYGALKSGQAQGQANELDQQAIDLALRDYSSREPLRQAFTQGILRDLPAAPDLSAAFADPSNPFSRVGSGRLPQVGSGFGDTQLMDVPRWYSSGPSAPGPAGPGGGGVTPGPDDVGAPGGPSPSEPGNNDGLGTYTDPTNPGSGDGDDNVRRGGNTATIPGDNGLPPDPNRPNASNAIGGPTGGWTARDGVIEGQQDGTSRLSTAPTSPMDPSSWQLPPVEPSRIEPSASELGLFNLGSVPTMPASGPAVQPPQTSPTSPLQSDIVRQPTTTRTRTSIADALLDPTLRR